MNSNELVIGDSLIHPGEVKNIQFKISESYLGKPVAIPIRVFRSKNPGPTGFITGGIHGDEMNGVAIIKDLMDTIGMIECGTLICIPLVNIFGFNDSSRYLPDRRDLNRCFPGNPKGSLAYRLAYQLFNDIILKCNFGIDCHTGATPRTNFPQIRADLANPEVKKLAEAFGAPVLLHGKGSPKTLRSSATRNGCPTIVFESGEVNKFEPETIQVGCKGIKNVLKSVKMLSGDLEQASPNVSIQTHHWIRSDYGGLLRSRVKPGDLVKKGDPLAICENLFTLESKTIPSPYTGVIIGLTLRPTIQPGEPVCNIGVISRKLFKNLSGLSRIPCEPSEKTHLPGKLVQLLGWREWVSFPELGIESIKAKLDTGARTSSIHAYNVRTIAIGNDLFAQFEVHPIQKNNDIIVPCQAKVIDKRDVKSSSGHTESRYVIQTTLLAGSTSWPIELNLTNRDEMGFRLLLGRNALKNRIIIDPGKSFQARTPSKAERTQ